MSSSNSFWRTSGCRAGPRRVLQQDCRRPITSRPPCLSPRQPDRQSIRWSERACDAPAQALAGTVREWLSDDTVKSAVRGAWLGHPVHPPLTDVVLGSFLSESLLALVAPRSGARAAQRLISLGIAAAAPTALTGFSDWADTELSDEGVRRVGLVHAGTNVSALLLYIASLVARRRGARLRGSLLALAGAGLLGGSALLGGHMAYVRGVGVNQTAFDPGPENWTPVSRARKPARGNCIPQTPTVRQCW